MFQEPENTEMAVFTPKSLKIISKVCVLENGLHRGLTKESFPAKLVNDLEEEVTGADTFYRVFTTLEDDLCAQCAWDESEDLGDNGHYLLDFTRLIDEMDPEHYFTCVYIYNRYIAPKHVNVICEGCDKNCYFEVESNAGYLMTADVVEEYLLYTKNMFKELY